MREIWACLKSHGKKDLVQIEENRMILTQSEVSEKEWILSIQRRDHLLIRRGKKKKGFWRGRKEDPHIHTNTCILLYLRASILLYLPVGMYDSPMDTSIFFLYCTSVSYGSYMFPTVEASLEPLFHLFYCNHFPPRRSSSSPSFFAVTQFLKPPRSVGHFGRLQIFHRPHPRDLTC